RCGASREKSRGDNAAKNRLNLPCPNWRATGVVPYGIDGALAFDDGAAASSNETLSPAQYDDQMRGGENAGRLVGGAVRVNVVHWRRPSCPAGWASTRAVRREARR